ncbi:internal scaffolding protein [Microviridae sp.]|nr:internal scaffolding protein [Microviridae sp.]
MDKFHKTGILTHLAKYGAQYGEASSHDLLDAMTTLTTAQEMYDAVPSKVRKQFTGPEEFLDFVSDPANVEKLREWGLATGGEEPDPILVRVQPEPGPDPEPEPEPA